MWAGRISMYPSSQGENLLIIFLTRKKLASISSAFSRSKLTDWTSKKLLQMIWKPNFINVAYVRWKSIFKMGHFQTGFSKNAERGSLFMVLHLFFIGIEFILESHLKMFMGLCEIFTILFWKMMQFGEVTYKYFQMWASQ